MVRATRDRVEHPVVLCNAHRETAIQLFKARTYSYLCRFDRGIRVDKVRSERVERDYVPLHYYEDGHPGPKPYLPEDAARRFLNWGLTAGITEVAERALHNIIKGVKDMSNVETATEKQGDTRIPAVGELGAALAKAVVGKASTKKGTSAAAKRPSKAKTVKVEEGPKPGPTPNGAGKPTTKGTDVKKTTSSKPKAATKAKPAAKKTASGKPKAATKAKPSAKKEKGNGRPTTLDTDKTIKVVAEENPRREGSKGYQNWAVIKRYNGKKVGAYLDAGGRADNLRKDISRGNVKLV